MRTFHGPHRFSFGWLPNASIRQIQGCVTGQTINLVALSVLPSSSSVSMIQIPRPSGGNTYVSFRIAVGQDINTAYMGKVGVHRWTGVNGDSVFLWKYLSVGETTTITEDLCSVTMLSLSGTVASVQVTNCQTRPTPSPSSTPDPLLDCSSGLQTGSTVGAVDDWPGITGVSNGGEDRSFTFVVTTTGLYTFSSCGSSFDTMLQVFISGTLTSVAANDDSNICGSGSAQSFVSVSLSPVCFKSETMFSKPKFIYFLAHILDCRGWIRWGNRVV